MGSLSSLIIFSATFKKNIGFFKKADVDSFLNNAKIDPLTFAGWQTLLMISFMTVTIVSVIGYTVIVSLLVIYNYKKTNVLYFYPPEGKRDVYLYFSIPLLAIKNKVSGTEISKQEAQKAYKWLKDNNFKLKDELDIDKITGVFSLPAFMTSAKDKIKFYDYTNKRQYEILIENPLVATKQIIKGTIHFSVLNPIHNYYYNEHRGLDKKPAFIKSKTHKN